MSSFGTASPEGISAHGSSFVKEVIGGSDIGGLGDSEEVEQ
jgi:hypothetical protein